MNIYFWGVFYLVTFIRYIIYCNRSWFVLFFNCVVFIIFGGNNCFWLFLWFLCFVACVNILFCGGNGCVDFFIHVFPWFLYFVNCVIFFVEVIDASSFSFFFFFKRTEAWYSSTLSNFVFSFYCHCYPTRYQLKWETSSLPCKLQNQIKLLIFIPKIKALLEGGQQLYTKNATSQGLVIIQRRNGYLTRDKLVTLVPVDSYRYIEYLETIHLPLKGDRSFKAITSTFVTFHPNLLSTLGLLRKSNKGGPQKPWDS